MKKIISKSVYMAVSFNTENYFSSIAWAQLLIQPAVTLAATKTDQKHWKAGDPLALTEYSRFQRCPS